MKTSIGEASWMGLLIRKYEKIPAEKLDEANEIVLNALDKMTNLLK